MFDVFETVATVMVSPLGALLSVNCGLPRASHPPVFFARLKFQPVRFSSI